MSFVEREEAGVAQLVEYELPKLGVAGSNPVARSSRPAPRSACLEGGSDGNLREDRREAGGDDATPARSHACPCTGPEAARSRSLAGRGPRRGLGLGHRGEDAV